jgi:hypothetical protein
MFCEFYPCAYARDVFSIDYQALFDNGYRGILFDVDNTLVHHNEDTTPAVDALLEKIAAADSLDLFHFVPFETLLVPMIVTFCAAGMFVGIVGSWTSIRKFMDV